MSGANKKPPVCYIVGAGEDAGLDFARRECDYVIAADGGLAYLEAAGIRPDMAIGDFDSHAPPAEGPEGVKIERLPCEKDDTDTLAAVRRGLGLGFGVFLLYNCTGGRLEHTLANIQTLAHIANEGGRGFLVGPDFALALVRNGRISFGPGCGGYVSVFAHTDIAKGVNIGGLKYEMREGELTSAFPIGVSNEFDGRPASVEVADGALAVVFPRRCLPKAV